MAFVAWMAIQFASVAASWRLGKVPIGQLDLMTFLNPFILNVIGFAWWCFLVVPLIVPKIKD
jgi:hypothetical protein